MPNVVRKKNLRSVWICVPPFERSDFSAFSEVLSGMTLIVTPLDDVLAAILQITPELVVIGQSVPQALALELARTIKRTCAEPPLVVAIANMSVKDKGSIDRVLTAQPTPAQVRAVLRRVVGRLPFGNV